MNHGSSSLEELSCEKNCSVRCTEHVGLSCGAYGGTSRWKRAIVDDNRGHGLESSGAAVRCLGRRISQAASGSAISLFSGRNGGEQPDDSCRDWRPGRRGRADSGKRAEEREVSNIGAAGGVDWHRDRLHLPSAPGELRLSGPVLADIFLGKIKTWSDPAIAKLNPGMKLPAKAIQVIHRTDRKGSNYILSDFLCKVSPEFMGKLGRGESPKWPVGTSAARSQDMAEKVRGTDGSIGYTELNLAESASLRMARIKNAAGEFVMPTTKSISAAGLGCPRRGDFCVSV